MGCKIRDLSDENPISISLSDALLFTTMCILGLPVEVQVKDGSIYSGIFHTSSAEKDYAIVLKTARMIKKGKNETNLPNGALIDTLVVLSGDLVQVGVLVPGDGIVSNVGGDDVESAMGTDPPPPLDCSESERKSEIYTVETMQIDQTRSADQNENGSAHGFASTTFEANLLTEVEKGLKGRKLAAKSFGSVLEVENGKIDVMHLAKIEEASSVLVNGGQFGEDRPLGEKNVYEQKCGPNKEGTIHEETHVMTSRMLPNGASCDSPVPSLVKPDTQCCEGPTLPVFPSSDAISSVFSASSTSVFDSTPQSCPSSSALSTSMVPPRSSISNTSAKEFKLNPGAKIFAPSFAIPSSATPPAVPTVTSMAYIPNSISVLPVAGAQPEIGISPFAPHSSLPVKLVQYNDLVAGNGGSGSQFSQPIVGHVGSRPQPVRLAGQYHPVQPAPAYVHPNSQAVMVGRLGQLIYMHPVSHVSYNACNVIELHDVGHLRILSSCNNVALRLTNCPFDLKDAVQGAAALSQVSVRPLLNPYQAHLPKHQGSAAAQALQLCVTPPPFITAGQQSFAVPSHIPLSQSPFPTIRHIPVPGANGFFSSKFP
ncbi:hypothetical protein HHK36_003258 [Tetracentron sinense]|uniref:Ataxin 2 SM domain-containing protein n=1 Tax=Tetracentron sinense TaxID=13715 RepID=A0A834ZXA1_TETSI|nr:hypothetical protein HHK36_003258 [Tetracentron sinense]